MVEDKFGNPANAVSYPGNTRRMNFNYSSQSANLVNSSTSTSAPRMMHFGSVNAFASGAGAATVRGEFDNIAVYGKAFSAGRCYSKLSK